MSSYEQSRKDIIDTVLEAVEKVVECQCCGGEPFRNALELLRESYEELKEFQNTYQ